MCVWWSYCSISCYFSQVVEAGGGWGKLLEDLPPTPMILAAQAYVQERLEKKWLPQFLATEEFADRQRPRSGMSEVVEDVMIHRKKKSQAIFKVRQGHTPLTPKAPSFKFNFTDFNLRKITWRVNPYSAGIDSSSQNLTPVDVRFWRLKSIPSLWE